MSREPILVVLADGIGYAGALASGGTEPAVLNAAPSSATSLGAAIAELAGTLAGPEGRVRRAVVLSWQVQCAVVALPVDPRRPLPETQMREAVRWEMEPFVAGARARRLGAILVGRGHLTPGDRDRLLAAA
ncbi:MAG: hypothetical protein J0M02_05095, partial [Planctomycetes bacterium]|nr:hypothetical protein [Planctomycetota bacterium]